MQGTTLVRASISFPPGLYETLEEIAKRKKVSLAWVVRDAAERYVADETELTDRKAELEILSGIGKLARRT